MLIENLSKEIDAKAMTAVRGGSYDSQTWVPVSNRVSQVNFNAINGNMGQVQISNNQSATESTSVATPVNYGLILSFLPRLFA